ncbi:MAG TPA: VIT1/CCC1 transporter family protein, partial [Candidatus Cybelea sp.]
SFAAGSLVPIVAFLLPLAIGSATIAALAFALVGLFAVGYYAGTLSERSALRKGFEVAAYGCVVFGISYLAGQFIPPLFGHAAVPVGG